VVPAIILQSGLYFETILALVPDFVTVTIALALRSIAVVQVAWHTASVTFGLEVLSLWKNLLQ